MILVGTTLTTFAMKDPEVWGSWLVNAEAIANSVDEEVRYLAAIETDARGLDPFTDLLQSLHSLHLYSGVRAEAVTFRIDDRDAVTSHNRLHHITAGRNLLTDVAVDEGAGWLFFVDADVEHPPEALARLLELDHPLTGCHVPLYGLGGPAVSHVPEGADVRVHMNTAGSCLVRRDLFRRLRWRHDPDEGMTDDPCYHHDARTLHGVEWLVRHDVEAIHHPGNTLLPLEQRGHDLEVRR